MNLQKKVVIITGASEGIGEQIALRLAKEETKLALVARSKDKLESVAEKAKELGAGEVKIYPQDLSKIDEISSLVKQIHSDFGAIDVLINNAGSWIKMGQADEADMNLINTVVTTNLTSAICLVHSSLPILRKQEEAAIINIGSKAGVVPQKGMSIYSATKYGLRGFTDVLKEDLKDSSVRVAGIYQAGIKTSMLANGGETASMPIEKFSSPEDLADIICYMLSQPPKIWMHDVRVTY